MKIEFEVGTLAQPVGEAQSSQGENDGDEERGLAASQDGGALPGTASGQMVNQLGEAPDDDDDGPESPNDVGEADVGVEAKQQENKAEQNQEQAGKDRAALRTAWRQWAG